MSDDYAITTTRQELVNAIHDAVAETFSDWRITGPPPIDRDVASIAFNVLKHLSEPTWPG